ncbi:MAG: hypothetical protein Q8Q33_00495 [Chlamydiota bacterium]|nr:hypothetical protein [Chlamydiota bacterium]
MRKALTSAIALFAIFSCADLFAASVSIDKYPTSIKAGDTVDVVVRWAGVPTDKDYILRIQLENWDVNPGILILKDVEKFSESGAKVITVEVPKKTPKASGCRFLAVFLSKTDEWDDVFAVSETPKDVNIGGLLDISNYPKSVKAGTTVSVNVSWEGIPTNEDLKLVVQLENWDVKPGIVYYKEVNDFKTTGSMTLDISVPQNARDASGCRFVVAFISKTEGWGKTFTILRTDKDVSLEKASE